MRYKLFGLFLLAMFMFGSAFVFLLPTRASLAYGESCPKSGYTLVSNLYSCNVLASNQCAFNEDCSVYGGGSCQAQSSGGCSCGVTGIGSCCQPANSAQYATKQTADVLASCMGATVVENYLSSAGPYQVIDKTTRNAVPSYGLKFCSGVELNAGLVADSIENKRIISDPVVYANDAHKQCDAKTGLLCGNGLCDKGETSTSCSADCKSATPPPGGDNPPPDGNAGSQSSTQNSYINSLISIVNSMIEAYKSLISSNAAGTQTPVLTPVSNFPTKVTVNVSLLNVRQSPSTTVLIVEQLSYGTKETVYGVVNGEVVEGEGRWWILNDNTYAWVGGTTEKPSSSL